MSHLYLLKSSKQMSFSSLVLHKYGICCCISSYASQFLEYLFIKWHKTVNQHKLFQGGGGHAAGKKQSSGFYEVYRLGTGPQLVCVGDHPSIDGELQLLPSETLELASVSFFSGFFVVVFCLRFFYYHLSDYAVFQYSGAPRISVGGNRGTAIIAMFFSSRLVL